MQAETLKLKTPEDEFKQIESETQEEMRYNEMAGVPQGSV